LIAKDTYSKLVQKSRRKGQFRETNFDVVKTLNKSWKKFLKAWKEG